MSDVASHFTYDPAKFTELLHHLVARAKDDPHAGAKKLAKLMFFCDARAFLERGAPITGVTYMHFKHGPFTKEFYRARDGLIGAGMVSLVHEYAGIFTVDRLIARSSPTFSALSADDVALADAVYDELRSYPAHQLETMTHDLPAYRLTQMTEEIPYASLLLANDASEDDEPLPAEVLEHGKRLAEALPDDVFADAV